MTSLQKTKKFHTYHGSNVILDCEGTLASRKTSYANALVFSEHPLAPNDIFLLEIEEIERGWSGDMRIGLTTMNPDEAMLNNWALPQYALPDLSTVKPSWIYCISKSSFFNKRRGPHCVWTNSFYKNGALQQYYSPSTETIEKCATDVGSQIGLVYVPVTGESADLHFVVNGVDQGVFANIRYEQSLYVVVDIYGCTKKVRAIQPRYSANTLQELCRESILHHITMTAVQRLPLPTALKNYLMKPMKPAAY